MSVAKRVFTISGLVLLVLSTAGVLRSEERPKEPLRKCGGAWIGVPAPDLKSPQEVADHLRRKVNFPLWWSHRKISSFWSTPIKNLGIFGWTDYCAEACGAGVVLQAADSIHGFYTVDVALGGFTVEGQVTRLVGPRFLRVEMHGKMKSETSMLPRPGDDVRICGKLMWDGDGFLEVHPRSPADVEFVIGTYARAYAPWPGTNAPWADDYSTVTDLARLRGWSTSQPRRTAMW